MSVFHENGGQLLLILQLFIFGFQRGAVAANQVLNADHGRDKEEDTQDRYRHDLHLWNVGIDCRLWDSTNYHPVLKSCRLIDKIVGDAVGAVLDDPVFFRFKIFRKRIRLSCGKAGMMLQIK